MSEVKNNEITIRTLDERDGEAVRELAQRDSASVPLGRLVGASVDGRLVVAHSLATGAQIADPFVKTDELRKLVSQRVQQLNGVKHARGRRFARPSRGADNGAQNGRGGMHALPQRAV
jgi:hypothetical protein